MSASAIMTLGSLALQSGLSALNQRARSRFLAAQANRAAAFGVARSADTARAGRSMLATATVRAASSGFTTGGSAEDVIARLAQEAETSRQRALYEGFREADDLRYQAAQERQNAALNSGVAGVLSGGIGLKLSGAFD